MSRTTPTTSPLWETRALKSSFHSQCHRRYGYRDDHIVKLSTQEAGWDPVEGHGHWHKEREELIRQSGLQWTFLRPSMFMNFTLSWIPAIRAENAIYWAGGNGNLGAVHPWDVAAVAKAALTSPGHENKAYELTGPELLNFSEMASVLSEVS